MKKSLVEKKKRKKSKKLIMKTKWKRTTSKRRTITMLRQNLNRKISSPRRMIERVKTRKNKF